MENPSIFCWMTSMYPRTPPHSCQVVSSTQFFAPSFSRSQAETLGFSAGSAGSAGSASAGSAGSTLPGEALQGDWSVSGRWKAKSSPDFS